MHISTLQALIARCIAICAACNNRNGQHCAEEDPQDANRSTEANKLEQPCKDMCWPLNLAFPEVAGGRNREKSSRARGASCAFSWLSSC